uniref:(northern house mosquito) hypothetical protein n=1 Tax=Culex pipiens TaxID=7175 RepID=A0A8D8GX40_CULPI
MALTSPVLVQTVFLSISSSTSSKVQVLSLPLPFLAPSQQSRYFSQFLAASKVLLLLLPTLYPLFSFSLSLHFPPGHIPLPHLQQRCPFSSSFASSSSCHFLPSCSAVLLPHQTQHRSAKTRPIRRLRRR